MIVKMKKVTVLALAGDKTATLDALRDLGVLHLEPVSEVKGATLEQARLEESSAKAAAFVLERIGEPKEAPKKMGGGVSGAEAIDAAAAVLRIHELGEAKRAVGDRIVRLSSEKSSIEPFGDFDPEDVLRLADQGISVKLVHLPGKKIPPAPEDGVIVPIRRDSVGLYAAVAGKGPFAFPGREIPLPTRRLSAIEAEIETAKAEQVRIGAELEKHAAQRRDLDSLLEERRARVLYLEADAGMGAAGKIAYLQGYVPVPRIASLRKAAAENGWGLLFAEPAAGDKVPTLIKSPAWLRPIESLFGFIKILPGYREADVSAAFLIFLSLFFAMIIGDAGYGAILLSLTAFARMRNRKAAPEPFRLLTIFSVATIVWGLLTGVVFGLTKLPAPLAALKIDWLNDNDNIMLLCLVIGAVHLSLAHLWNMVRFINSPLAIAQLGWVSMIWTIFFAARALLLKSPFPSWYVPVAIAGLAAILLFMTPRRKMKTEWINHAMLPLTLMSNFGDILSYLRLFALGVASIQLAGAFNNMANGLGFSNPATAVIAVVIVLLGHTLNLGLGLVSVLVHGLRLNALEFSTHFGLEWAGFAYEPFRTKKTETDKEK